MQDPIHMKSTGLSDHAPVNLHLGQMKHVARASRPIPKHICKHARFKTLLAKYSACIDWPRLSAPEQYCTHCCLQGSKSSERAVLSS